MLHCQKIAKGRSPSVITNVDWKNLTREVDLIARDVSKLPWMWLSATEGDVNGDLGRLPHWPDEEEVENHSTAKLEAKFKDKYPKELYASFSKFRTCMRVKSLNRQYLHKNSSVTVVRDAKQRAQFMA